MPNLRDLLARLTRAALLAVCCAVPVAAADEHHHDSDSDWLLFPAVQLRGRSDTTEPAPESNYERYLLDVLFSHSQGRFRALMETEITSEEFDIERLQIGWEFSENVLGWAGRFHQPSSTWNTAHHHGPFLQTAITRPNIEHWEDDGGLIPQHIAGALIESRGTLGSNGGLAVSFGAGAAPVIRLGQLEPIQISRSNVGGHRASFSGRIAYEPEYLGEDSVGVVVARHDVNVLDPAVAASFGSDDVKLNVVGIYFKLVRSDWRVQAPYYYVDTHFDSAPAPRHEHFGAGYLQVEHPVAARLTPYGRIEASSNAAHSVYVAFQSREFEVRRSAAGLRWDFNRRQALTLEAAHATTLLTRYNEARLQWCGVFP